MTGNDLNDMQQTLDYAEKRRLKTLIELSNAEARIKALEAVLQDAERFMAYFTGETGGAFSGPGTPQTCLAAIRAVLNGPPA